MAGKTTAKERLARLLKQSSSIPELREFRSQIRDIHSMGGVMGVDAWIDARRELGLISGQLVNKAADELQFAIARLIEESMVKPPPAAKPALTWEERVALLNARETKRRESPPPTGYRPPPHWKPKPQPKPRVERQRPLSPTTPPEPKPTSLLERMAAAWDRLTPRGRNV